MSPSVWPHGRRASRNVDRAWRDRCSRELRCLALLSFERPAGESPRLRPRRTLKTAQLAKQRKRRSASLACGRRLKDHRCITRCFGIAVINDHRQDSKGTRWMPWHQESKKGVDGCDKPR
jgi:hypothetical protein